MLMALLPLVGWAEDISVASIAVGDIVYGNDAPTKLFVVWKGETLKQDEGSGGQYTWDGSIYKKEACADADKVVAGTTLEVGEYWVKIAGVPAEGFSGEAKGSFNVTKAPLTVEVTGGKFTKTYGEADPAETLDWEYKSGATKDDVATIKTKLVTGKVAYTYTGTNAGKYGITFSGLSAKNYEINYVAKQYTINAKELNAKDFTYELKEASAIYSSVAQVPAYTVKFGSQTLTQGQDGKKDFKVNIFKTSERSGSPVEATDVAKYYTVIVGTGNFSGTYYSTAKDDAANYIWDITKATVTVRALNQVRDYTGNATLPKSGLDEAYEFMGVKLNDDATKWTEPTLTPTAANKDEILANAGTHAIVPSYEEGKEPSANYNYNYVDGTLTINKLKLEIKANNEKKTYGTKDAFATDYTGVTFTVKSSDGKTDITSTEPWKTEVAEMAKASTKTVQNPDIKVTRSNADETTGTYKGVLVPSYNAKAAVFANYDVTLVNGDFAINGGKIVITAENKSKTYGDADPEFTYIITGLSEGDELKKLPTLTRDKSSKTPEAAGKYVITPAGAEIPDNYEGVEYATGTLTINPMELEVTVLPQLLTTGTTADKLDLDATVNFTKGAIVNGDKAKDVYELSYATKVTDINTDNKKYEAGIEFALKTGVKNYSLKKATAGDVEFYDPTKALVLDDANAKLAETITTANSKENRVIFTTRSLKREVWNTLVLPFETSVTEIASKLGYAVVDILNTDAKDGDVHFKLYMGKIPANTPFILKYWKDDVVDGKGKVTTDNSTLDLITISFAGKTIVKPATADKAGNPYVKDGANNQLIGTYTEAKLTAGDTYYYMTAGGEFKSPNKKYTEESPMTLKPLRAYIQMGAADASRRIFIEEPDGTTTVINGVATNVEVKAAEGWYNMNGVKLDAKPTQKGIYIMNGKKVVVK